MALLIVIFIALYFLCLIFRIGDVDKGGEEGESSASVLWVFAIIIFIVIIGVTHCK